MISRKPYNLLDMTLYARQVAGDSPQKEVDTSKLIDQNMALQKANSVLDRELEGVRAQNVELVHQRDFYQDQVII